ncbi:hypothetical protein PMIN02_010697 [Paraphaeosphaeria minitans]
MHTSGSFSLGPRTVLDLLRHHQEPALSQISRTHLIPNNYLQLSNMANDRPSVRSNAGQLRIQYLTFYNAVFASLWAATGITALIFVCLGSSKAEIFQVEPLARWTQTLTLVEIVHAAVGIVKSPVSTTATQVLTRCIQVWMIWWCFPSSTASSYAFLILVLAWATADAIRYLYLALNIHGKAPKSLVWLRYNMFYPLYPIGIGAEWWLMYRSVGPVGRVNATLPYVWYFLLALYVPGAYTMSTYMVKQKRKILGRRENMG